MAVLPFHQLDLFRHLSDTTLATLLSLMGQRSIAAGELLFQQGDPGDTCYVIVSGELEVFTYAGTTERQLEVFYAGQLVGEMALLDQSPRSAAVRALADSELLVLGEAAFKTLIEANPDLAMSMLRSGAARVRTANQRMIADLEQKNAELHTAYQQLQAAQTELIRLSRLDEEFAVARRIQASFLPEVLPQPRGWQFAAYSRAAQAVGGDFFDCIALGQGQFGLVVADVCGKGVTAALFVALTRSLLRAASQAPWIFQGGLVRDASSVLAGALWLVNDYICREHEASNMFITLFYGVIDTHTGTLAYANAGHNPPLIVHPDGTIVETSLGGTPLGIIAAQTYDVMTLTLEPGARLIVFSDGITEATSRSEEFFGDERLLAALASRQQMDAEALVRSIISEVDAFNAGVPQADDITLLVAARVAA